MCNNRTGCCQFEISLIRPVEKAARADGYRLDVAFVVKDEISEILLDVLLLESMSTSSFPRVDKRTQGEREREMGEEACPSPLQLLLSHPT